MRSTPQWNDVLVTFIGMRDPAWRGDDGAAVPGPVLSVLQERCFGAAYLLFNIAPDWNERAARTKEACQVVRPGIVVEYVPLDIVDVSDLRELYRVMNHACQSLQQRHVDGKSRFFVSTASGTPAMQTIWVLLVQSGLFPATLLHVTHPLHRRKGRPLVRELRLDLEDFPQVQSPETSRRSLGVLQAQVDSLKAENAMLKAAPYDPTDEPLTLPLKGLSLTDVLAQTEHSYYARAFKQANGNCAEAARLLNLQPPAYRKRAAQLGLYRRRKRA